MTKQPKPKRSEILRSGYFACADIIADVSLVNHKPAQTLVKAFRDLADLVLENETA